MHTKKQTEYINERVHLSGISRRELLEQTPLLHKIYLRYRNNGLNYRSFKHRIDKISLRSDYLLRDVMLEDVDLEMRRRQRYYGRKQRYEDLVTT